eukprot:4778276-Pyramimonas_sp.AAC.1
MTIDYCGGCGNGIDELNRGTTVRTVQSVLLHASSLDKRDALVAGLQSTSVDRAEKEQRAGSRG